MIVYCSQCLFFIPHKLPEFGQCRRNAPSPVKSASNMFIGAFNERAIWPFVRVNDFCGDGEKGAPPLNLPKEAVNQEVKFDTLEQVSKFEMAVRNAMPKKDNGFDSNVEKAREKFKED